MAKLLQAHVFLPEIEDSKFDEMFDIINQGFAIVDDGDLSGEAWELNHQAVEVELSTQLFEERADNLERLETLYSGVVDAFPNATVFKYREEQAFGESRSASDPNEHVIVSVVNQGIEQPRIQWRQEIDPFEVSPRMANGRVFHATSGQVIALDGASGDVLWTDLFEDVGSVPEARDDLVVAKGGWTIRGYDAATGSQRWEFHSNQQAEGALLESRAKIGTDAVYVGTRGGDVLTIEQENGTDTIFASFDTSVHQLITTDDGLLVRTADGKLHALDTKGVLRWTQEGFAPKTVRDGIIYGTGRGTVQARSLGDGSKHWSVEMDRIEAVSVSDAGVFVSTNDHIHRLNAATGEGVWTCELLEDELVNKFESVTQISPGMVLGLDSKSVVHMLDSEAGERISTFALGGPTSPPALIDEAAVFVTGPEIVCLEDFPEF